MKHCGTKQLETERLILRRFRPEDAAAMYNNWASDDEVTKYLMWPTHSSIEVSQYVTNDWVNSYSKDDFYQWAIVPKENNDKPIGSISMVSSNENLSMPAEILPASPLPATISATLAALSAEWKCSAR